MTAPHEGRYAREASYTWDIASDKLEWSAGALDVLGVASLADVATSAGLQAHMVPEHLTRWRHAIAGAPLPSEAPQGVPYRVQYRFRPAGQASERTIWLEDSGRLWTGSNGRPARAEGKVRVIDEGYLEEQRRAELAEAPASGDDIARASLTKALAAVISQSEFTRQSSAFLLVSIDSVPEINAKHGFDIGDEVIAAVARLLKQKLRRGDTVGYVSSNRLGLILNDCNTTAMNISAQRFSETVRAARIRTSACDLSTTITLGGVSMPDEARTVAEALSKARDALQSALEGKGLAQAASQAASRAMSGTNRVLDAIEQQRLRFVLQPIVEASSGKTAAYECLLRVAEPGSEQDTISAFIALAEELGLTTQVDRATLSLAMPLLKQHPALRLSLNVSSLTTNDPDWVMALHKLAGGRREVLERLTIEITETAMIQDVEKTAAFIEMLREIGCRVAIDDFGAGYTSFRHLKQLSVDMLKIDGTFVKNLPRDPQDVVLVRTMVEMAKVFGLKSVAEWVGDEETATLLREMGVDYLQGFHFGQPIAPEDLPKS